VYEMTKIPYVENHALCERKKSTLIGEMGGDAPNIKWFVCARLSI